MSNQSYIKIQEQIVNYNNNILDLISQLNSLVGSNDSSVQISFTDENRNLTTYDLPSWGYLQKEIKRLNNNINTLFAINENGARIQTSDNVWRKLILVDLEEEPNPIQNVSILNNFISDQNHFFDSLLNPNLSVEIDLSDKVSDTVREVLVRRYIIDFDRNVDGTLSNNGQIALDSFNANFRGKNDINLGDFLEWHETTPGVRYATNPYYDEEKYDLEPKRPLYDGYFSVFRTEEDSVNKKLFYVLNSLDYRLTTTNEIKQLAVGDKLVINRENTATIYEIKEILTGNSNPRVRLERTQGNETVPVGEGTLKAYGPSVSEQRLKVTIGYNERNVVFLKSINSNSYMEARNWSGGVGFFTNDLNLSSNDSDNGKTMDEYYTEKVSDYGLALKDLVKTKTPIERGAIPNRPILLENNFKVVQINKHLTDNQDKKEIANKFSQMEKLRNEIGQLDSSISSKTKQMRLSTFKSNNEKKAAEKDLQNLISKKNNASSLLRSASNEIITMTNDPNSNRKVTPKFRVRGFWDIPEPKLIRGSRPQEIVQFKIQYRYASLSGEENSIESFKLQNSDGSDSANAIFSNWSTLMSDTRQRVYNEELDVYEWVVQDVSEADTPNINQLDIPIQPNERVEIRIKSLSEVGYPESPIESDWSEIFTIDFPDDLSTVTNSEDFILQEASRQDTIVQLRTELGNVDEHLNDQTTVGDNTYYHAADTVLAMIPNENGEQQSLLDFLVSMQNRINSLEEQINRTRGILQVYVYRNDESFLVKNDTELQFNVECEDYLDKYEEDSSVTGRVYRNNIYTVKDFYVRVVNASSSSPLGLLSSKNYNNQNIYSQNSPQIFWTNDRDELLFNTGTGVVRTQLNNQFFWSVNFDSGNSNNINKLSENIGNNFTTNNSNSLTPVLSSTEYNLGYSENTILEFNNNNSLLDLNKWVDDSPTVNSATKLLTTTHPSIQNLEDLVENNSDKVRTFQANEELIIPMNIYFKMNAFDPNNGTGKDYDYVDLNNVSTTTRHIKKLKFYLENEAENKPFIFRVKFTINRNKVVVQKLGQNNQLSQVSRFKFRPFNGGNSLIN